MAMSARGARFNQLIGDEMSQGISRSDKSARAVAREMGIDPTSLHRYTTATVSIPVHITVEVCEKIGIDPQDLAERAYLRLLDELGKPED